MYKGLFTHQKRCFFNVFPTKQNASTSTLTLFIVIYIALALFGLKNPDMCVCISGLSGWCKYMRFMFEFGYEE